VGHEHVLELLVRSGLWARFAKPTKAIAPVLVWLAERRQPASMESVVTISYAGITRYSGVRSPNAIRKALVELSEAGLLNLPEVPDARTPERGAATYVVKPFSHDLWELAHAAAAQQRAEIAAERELRGRQRKERIRSFKKQAEAEGGADSTKYKSLYPANSVDQKHGIGRIA
jgi:hypothetical protein